MNRTFTEEELTSFEAMAVLVAHQRNGTDCLCGNLPLGRPHSEHVLKMLVRTLSATQHEGLAGLRPSIKPTQHCTVEGCFTVAHTARWCGKTQPRRCGCHYCYPEGES